MELDGSLSSNRQTEVTEQGTKQPFSQGKDKVNGRNLKQQTTKAEHNFVTCGLDTGHSN